MTDKITPEQKQSKAPIIILALLLVAALGFIGYLFTKVSGLEEQLSTTEGNLETSIDENEGLQADLHDQIEEYKILVQQYEERGIENDELIGQIQMLEEQAQILRGSKAQSDREKRALQQKVKKLIAESELKRQALQEEIEYLKYVVDSQGVEMDNLIEVNGIQLEQNATLKQKVKIASILTLEANAIQIFNKKDKVEKPNRNGEYKSGDVKKIVVISRLAKNDVAKHDQKEIVLRIIAPSGNVIFSENNRGGSFETSNGETKFYTLKKMIEFDNTKQSVSFTFEAGEEEVEAGTYNVEVYTDTQLVKKNQFVVK